MIPRFLAAGKCNGSEEPRVALLGAPYDSTASYRAGSRFGPARIREASHSLEEYCLRLDGSLEQLAFTDLGDLELPFGSPEAALAPIEAAVAKIVTGGAGMPAGCVPFLIGGEHLITLAAIRALADLNPVVVQLDAHADLRAQYMEEPLSHATVMRRVAEIVGPENVYAIGIRSGSAEEIAWGRQNINLLSGPVAAAAQQAAMSIGRRPVYVTIDIDVLDPSVAPGTGNAEPGGISFESLVAAIDCLRQCQIVGVDLVEVAPPLDPSGRTEIVAAALIRHILISWFVVGGRDK